MKNFPGRKKNEISIFIFDNFYGNKPFENQILKDLETLANSKANLIQEEFNEVKNDIFFLSESNEIKNIFNQDLIYDVNVVKTQVRLISQKVSKEIENYLVSHPEMTLEDLLDNEEFNKIAVQQVGETGYTYVNSMVEGILYFHPDPNARYKSYNAWKERFPNIWKLNEDIAQSSPCQDSEGFYDWKDINGVIRKKYTYHSCINAKTKDNYTFYVGASTYIDEYGETVILASELDKELRIFQEVHDYDDLILINKNGEIIWTFKKENYLGINLNKGIYNSSTLSKIYNKVESDLGISVFGPIYSELTNENIILVTSPIFNYDNKTNKNNLIGIIAIKLKNDYLNYYTQQEGKSTEIIKKSGIYKNYVDKPVFGAHQYVLESGLCLLVEISEK